MSPQSPSKSKRPMLSAEGSPPTWRSATRDRRTLYFLAALWLLGGVDLSMTTLAQQHDLLDAGGECNPLAALVLPFGFWPLLAYKLMFTTVGSTVLLLYGRWRIAQVACGVVLAIYALMAIQWMAFYGILVPLREVSLSLGDFCHSVDWIGCTTLGCIVAICLTACVCARQLPCQNDRSAVWSRRRAWRPRKSPAWNARGRVSTSWSEAAALTICASLFPLCCSATPPRLDPVGKAVDGTIYFRESVDASGRMWSMNADGSNKCMYPIGVRGEPSHRLHGGHRWFLDVRPIPGQSYADGGQRRELFAIRTDGLTFQLTDQPDLEPSPFTPRWLVHAEDRVISWIARRWDSTGEVVEGGVYIASVSFDEDGQVISLVQQPGDPLLRFELTHDWGPDPWWRTRVPDIQSHDWSPNGTAIVFNSTKYELFVADLQTRGLTRITDVPACSPAWSPDETRIAFRVYRPLGDIATIRPDGRELKTANIHPPGKLLSVTMPTWSPTGGRLAYRQVGFSKQVEYPAVSDVFVAAADGHAPANLTADFDAALVPLGWR